MNRHLVIVAIWLGLALCNSAAAVPPSVIRMVEPEYTEEALAANISGTVYLTAQIDENGIPHHLQLIRGLGWGLDRMAFQAVRLWRFRPALAKGKPARMRVPIEVNFRLKQPSV